MKINFLGATGTVTGSKYLVTMGSIKVLVDCGLFQGLKELRLRNWAEFPVDPTSINAVILTHAHIDHSGYVPLLVKNGFKGKVYCTKSTLELCRLLLPDSGKLQEEEAEFANKRKYSKHHPALPLYTQLDAEKSLTHFQVIDTDSEFHIKDTFHVKLIPSGHILGAAFVVLSDGKSTMTFSGDLGRPHDIVMRAPREIFSTDFLVLESTYGDREHPKVDLLEQLEGVINRTAKRGGSVIIPAFSVGRSQTLLYCLYLLKHQGRIGSIPIFLDSPMSINATQIFCNHIGEHRLNAEATKGTCEVARCVREQEESKLLDQRRDSMIIVSASGMATGGRILHHLKTFLPKAESTILLSGYQAQGTRGDALLKGAKTIKMFGEEVMVNAEISVMENLSAHADRAEILEWLSAFRKKPKKVFITHGEESSAQALKKAIEEKLNWHCMIPQYLQMIDLE